MVVASSGKRKEKKNRVLTRSRKKLNLKNSKTSKLKKGSCAGGSDFGCVACSSAASLAADGLMRVASAGPRARRMLLLSAGKEEEEGDDGGNEETSPSPPSSSSSSPLACDRALASAISGAHDAVAVAALGLLGELSTHPDADEALLGVVGVGGG